MRRLAVVLPLLLAGCDALSRLQPAPPPPVSAPPPALEERLRSCPAMPIEPAPPRTIEAVLAYMVKLQLAYRECAERHRLTVEVYDRLADSSRADQVGP